MWGIKFSVSPYAGLPFKRCRNKIQQKVKMWLRSDNYKLNLVIYYTCELSKFAHKGVLWQIKG